MIQKRHLLNTVNEVSYFIETHDSVMDIVFQNICHSHLFKSNQDVLHPNIYFSNDISDLITHQVFVFKFKHYFCECPLRKNQSTRCRTGERVERKAVLIHLT